MNPANTAFFALIFGACLLMYQRTERSRKWLTAVFLVLPVGVFIFFWAQGTGQWASGGVGVGVALLLNILFWLVYGRSNPPGTSDAINVIGMDD